MKTKTIVIFLVFAIIALMMLSGCSVARVFSSPPPVDVEKVKVGEQRNTIISVLGTPKTSEVKQDLRTDVYEFVDGHSSGSKVRAVLYIAGDFFTLGLAELLFWPIELAAGNGTAGRAIVDYGMDDIAKKILLTQSDGKPWEFAKTEDNAPQPALSKTTNKINPETGAIIQ